MKKGMTNTALKVIALVAMTLDHLGKQVFWEYPILQILGRLAFPIFAYMIAEGCTYTKNRKKYLLQMAGLAMVCQLVYFVAMGSLYQCVLVTFSLSIALIYILDGKKTKYFFLPAVVATFGLTECLPDLLKGTDFAIDYGIFGVMLPVVIFAVKEKWQKLAGAAIVLVLLAWSLGGIQWWSLLALLPLAAYNGERGKGLPKNFFYLYYPVHLGVIYGISLIL